MDPRNLFDKMWQNFVSSQFIAFQQKKFKMFFYTIFNRPTQLPTTTPNSNFSPILILNLVLELE